MRVVDEGKITTGYVRIWPETARNSTRSCGCTHSERLHTTIIHMHAFNSEGCECQLAWRHELLGISTKTPQLSHHINIAVHGNAGEQPPRTITRGRPLITSWRTWKQSPAEQEGDERQQKRTTSAVSRLILITTATCHNPQHISCWSVATL